MNSSRKFQSPFDGRQVFSLLLCFLLAYPVAAENDSPPNPFAGEEEAGGDFNADQDLMDNPVEDLGFEPPEDMEPRDRVDTAPIAPPIEDIDPQPNPSTPPPSRARRNAPPPRPSARPSTPPSTGSRLSNTRSRGQTATPPPPRPSSRSRTTSRSNRSARQAPKLDEYLDLDPEVKGLQVKNFDLPDKDIRDVVTLISRWTGKNFILDSKVRGKITIIGPSQVTLEEAYHAFLAALNANGLTTVKSGKFIRIIESAEARRSPVELYTGDYTPDTPKFITRITQLQYINADEVQREFRDLTTRQGKLFAYAPTNSIIITDTGENIRRIEEILRSLDIKGFETSLHVLPIRYTSAKAIADMLDEIYEEGSSGRTSSSRRSRRRSTFRRSSLDKTRGGGLISKIIPDEQTNSLVVLANAAGFRKLKQLVQKLDVKVTDTGRIHVYYCEYAKAEDLAATLASLAGGGSGSSTPRRSTGGGNNNNRRNTRVSQPQGGPSSPVSAELEGGVKITSDSSTNSLVITANSTDYQTLKKVIRKLDIPRLQVFVETAILEVTLDDRQEVSVNLASSADGRAFTGGSITNNQAITNLLTGGIPDGATIPIFAGSRIQADVGGTTVNLRSFMGLINLLTRTTNTSILSTPQIIALDNEEAEFKVQDEIPVQTSFTAVGGGASQLAGTATGSIERLKTGIEIKLTPHVNAASRTIRLEINQKVDSTKANTEVPAALAQIQRATTTRETNTKVVVRDGDFVMLGGLMSDKIDDSESKVPLLGDIPILGWLFKSSIQSVVKTNLIILLHPRIIGTSYGAAQLVDEKMERRSRFIQDNMGGNDVHERGVGELRGKVLDQKDRGRGSSPARFRSDGSLDDPRMGRARPGERSTIGRPRSSSIRQDYANPDSDPDFEEALMLPSDEELSRAPRRQGTPAPPPPRADDPDAPLLPDPDPSDNSLLIPEEG